MHHNYSGLRHPYFRVHTHVIFKIGGKHITRKYTCCANKQNNTSFTARNSVSRNELQLGQITLLQDWNQFSRAALYTNTEGSAEDKTQAQDQRSLLPMAKGDSGTGFSPSHQSCWHQSCRRERRSDCCHGNHPAWFLARCHTPWSRWWSAASARSTASDWKPTLWHSTDSTLLAQRNSDTDLVIDLKRA